MDLSQLQSGQMQALEAQTPKLFISAGAGTGKTETLTKKLAYLFTQDNDAALKDINDFLAITFTDAAAASLCGRTRSALRSAGANEVALAVDNAWISTIHGMCSRILREYAFELNIDPSFSVMSQQAVDDLIVLSLEEALAYDARTGMSEQEFDTLFEFFKANSGHSKDRSVTVYDVVKKLVELSSTVDLDSPSPFRMFTSEATLQKDMTEELWKSIQATDDLELIGKACSDITSACLLLFIKLAREVKKIYTRRKEQAGYLDNNDLLVKLNEALNTHPEIRERYAKQFKLIMVDEFQDTDWLQLDSINKLCEAGAQRVTVGDAQQSIYRFRGADVSLFRDTKEEVAALVPEEGTMATLECNFRSHPDILSFVNQVFEEPLGDDFIELKVPENYKETLNVDPSHPRVQLLHSTWQNRGGVKTEQALVYEARQLARWFKKWMDIYAAQGKEAPKMALLLGRMTHASVYAEELNKANVPAIISGGSGFWEAAEPAEIANVLRVLSNPHDEDALMRVLLSDVFLCTSDDLAELAFGKEGKKRGLWKGIVDFEYGNDSTPSLSPQAELAAHLLTRALKQAGHTPLASILSELFVSSGWAERLTGSPQLEAQAANVMKAIRIVGTIENDSSYGSLGDPVSVAHAFKQLTQAKSDREMPGTLAKGSSGVVNIMTIHSSKGLDFSVVAVAELSNPDKSPSGLVAETIAGTRYLGLEAIKFDDSKIKKNILPETIDYREVAGQSFEDVLSKAQSYFEFQAKLNALVTRENLAESWRLAYVAATRAEQALCMSFSEARIKNKHFSVTNPISSHMYETMGVYSPGTEAPREDCSFTLANGAASRLICIDLEADNTTQRVWSNNHPELHEEYKDEEEQTFTPAVMCERKDRAFEPASSDMLSYSKNGDELGTNITEYKEADYSCMDVDDLLEATSEGSQDEQATHLGDAFHRAAQLMIEHGLYNLSAHTLKPLDAKRVEALVREFGLSENQRLRFIGALEKWKVAVEKGLLDECISLTAELPFTVAVEWDSKNAYITGAIDALGETSKGPIIIDYKTGYLKSMTEQELHDAHIEQAKTYASALFAARSELTSCDAIFVHVENASKDGLRSVRFYLAR